MRVCSQCCRLGLGCEKCVLGVVALVAPRSLRHPTVVFFSYSIVSPACHTPMRGLAASIVQSTAAQTTSAREMLWVRSCVRSTARLATVASAISSLFIVSLLHRSCDNSGSLPLIARASRSVLRRVCARSILSAAKERQKTLSRCCTWATTERYVPGFALKCAENVTLPFNRAGFR